MGPVACSHVAFRTACLVLRSTWHPFLLRQGDVAMLLSSFSEMGLRLRFDMPDKAMAAAAFVFRRSAPLQEARVSCRENNFSKEHCRTT